MLTGKFYQIFKKEIIPILYNFIQKTKAEDYFLTHCIRMALPREDNSRKENYRQISVMKILANQIQRNVRGSQHQDHVGFCLRNSRFTYHEKINVCSTPWSPCKGGKPRHHGKKRRTWWNSIIHSWQIWIRRNLPTWLRTSETSIVNFILNAERQVYSAPKVRDQDICCHYSVEHCARSSSQYS